jgi:hypothetical protein
MKNIFIGILSLALFVFVDGCSRNTDPQFRIRNEQLEKVNVNIQSAGKDKFSIDGIEPKQTTAYQSASEGNITATVVIQNESVSFPASKNTLYTIVISTGKPPSIQIDQ